MFLESIFRFVRNLVFMFLQYYCGKKNIFCLFFLNLDIFSCQNISLELSICQDCTDWYKHVRSFFAWEFSSCKIFKRSEQRNIFLKLVKLNKIWIKCTLFRLNWLQTEFRLASNQSENCNYNLNLVLLQLTIFRN